MTKDMVKIRTFHSKHINIKHMECDMLRSVQFIQVAPSVGAIALWPTCYLISEACQQTCCLFPTLTRLFLPNHRCLCHRACRRTRHHRLITAMGRAPLLLTQTPLELFSPWDTVPSRLKRASSHLQAAGTYPEVPSGHFTSWWFTPSTLELFFFVDGVLADVSLSNGCMTQNDGSPSRRF